MSKIKYFIFFYSGKADCLQGGIIYIPFDAQWNKEQKKIPFRNGDPQSYQNILLLISEEGGSLKTTHGVMCFTPVDVL